MIYTVYNLSHIQLSYLGVPLIINVKQPKYYTVFVLLEQWHDWMPVQFVFSSVVEFVKGYGLCPCSVFV